MIYEINQIFYEDSEYSQRADFCNKNGLAIEEIEPDNIGRRFKIVKPIENEKQNQIEQLQNLLNKTDYVVTKLAEMKITNNENFTYELARYQDIIKKRVAWRTEIDRLMNE